MGGWYFENSNLTISVSGVIARILSRAGQRREAGQGQDTSDSSGLLKPRTAPQDAGTFEKSRLHPACDPCRIAPPLAGYCIIEERRRSTEESTVFAGSRITIAKSPAISQQFPQSFRG